MSGLVYTQSVDVEITSKYAYASLPEAERSTGSRMILRAIYSVDSSRKELKTTDRIIDLPCLLVLTIPQPTAAHRPVDGFHIRK